MSYLWTGYVLTWLALAVYAWRLESRAATAERELSFHEASGRDVPSGARDGRDREGGGRSRPAAGEG